MEREQLVGAGFGDERQSVLRWRCRAATCMRGAISRRRAAARPTNIAKWNGSSWSALGSGMGRGDIGVIALAVSGSDLYAGGYFTTAGGSAANYIAKWNGSSWSRAGVGDEQRCVCAGGVGQRPVCGRRVHDGGRQRGQLHCQMEREQLVGAGFGDERLCVLRWRCRAATCMRGAISRRRAAARPITLPNGTGAVGRRWARG